MITETGVSIMQMDEEIGLYYCRQSFPVRPKTTARQLHDELAVLGSKQVVRATTHVSEGQVTAIEQVHSATAQKLSRAKGFIDWSLSASQIERNIRALNPWPGTWFEFCGERVRFFRPPCQIREAILRKFWITSQQSRVVAEL